MMEYKKKIKIITDINGDPVRYESSHMLSIGSAYAKFTCQLKDTDGMGRIFRVEFDEPIKDIYIEDFDKMSGDFHRFRRTIEEELNTLIIEVEEDSKGLYHNNNNITTKEDE